MNQMFNNGSPDPSYSDYSNKEAARRFELAVYSMIDVLYRECGRDPKTLGCDYYAGTQKGLALKFRWRACPMDNLARLFIAKFAPMTIGPMSTMAVLALSRPYTSQPLPPNRIMTGSSFAYPLGFDDRPFRQS